MPQDWFDSVAVKPKVDPWFDQFDSKTAQSEAKPEENPYNKSVLSKVYDAGKSKLGDIISSPSTQRLLSGPTTEDQTKSRDFLFSHSSDAEQAKMRDLEKSTGKPVGQIIGPPKDDSILPANITGKHEPETYWGGVGNSLYKDFVRPLASPSSILGMISPGKISPTASHAAELAAVDKGLPINPAPVPLPENLARPQGAANARPGLPPAPDNISNPLVNKPRFISGQYGTAEADKLYPKDTAPLSPRLGQTTQPVTQGDGIVDRPVTILPRETEGITNLPGAEAARLGTGFGDIPKIETSSPKANIIGLDKVRNGSPVQLPKIDKLDIGNIGDPNLPYQSSSGTPSRNNLFSNHDVIENPNNNARPFGSTKNKSTNSWDTAREPKSQPQALGAVDAPTGNTTPLEQRSSSAVAKNSSNTIPSSGLPPAGSARAETPSVLSHSNSKDVNAIRAEVGSVDKTLASRPETAGIAQALTTAQDTKTKWIAETERSLADLTKGLGKADRVQLGDMLNRPITPQDNPQLAQRATQIRAVLDDIWKQIPGTKSNPQVGFIENYLTHIEKAGEDVGAKQVWENYFKKPFNEIFSSNELQSPNGKAQGLGDMYEKGLGDPNSPFAKTRTGALKDIQLDTNKVLPAYVESIAKLIHDKPAVDMAKGIINKLPDKDIYGQPSRLKDLAEWYVKNYTHYDAQPALGNVWNKYTNAIMKTTARSMLGFSTGLQTLHLARIPMNLYPELGEKYLLHGAAQVIKNPVAAYKEAASLGLLQNEVKPMAFKTIGEKEDSIIGFFQAADFLDKSIGYHGFKQRFLDTGMNEADAQMKAIAASKKASLTIDPSRSIRAFNPEPGLVGSVARLSSQFKQVPTKIIEQYVQIAAAAKENPKQAARALVGLGLTAAAAEAGFHTLHVSPKQFAIDAGGASFSVMRDIYREVIKGNVTKALGDTALWLVPAGRSIKRQMTSGLSMFDNSNKDLPMPK